MADTPYAVRDDIESEYGADNVAKWADLNNNENLTEIADRIDAKLISATTIINERLQGGPYAIPFVSLYPDSVIRNTALLAGVLLYESRGAVDYNPETGQAQHRYHFQKKEVEKWIHNIHAGRIKLSGVDRLFSSYPRVLNDTYDSSDPERTAGSTAPKP